MHQQRRTADHSSDCVRIPRKESYTPAKLAVSESSWTAEERTTMPVLEASRSDWTQSAPVTCCGMGASRIASQSAAYSAARRVLSSPPSINLCALLRSLFSSRNSLKAFRLIATPGGTDRPRSITLPRFAALAPTAVGSRSDLSGTRSSVDIRSEFLIAGVSLRLVQVVTLGALGRAAAPNPERACT